MGDDMTARTAARAHSGAVQAIRTHILHMRFEHGMTMAEIARRTGWPRSEVSDVIKEHAASREDDRAE